MINKTVKKWPMNDFLIAFEALIKEHGATLQATSSGSIGVSCGCYMRLDATLSSENIGNFINDSLRPENQIKEQKMEKQKYKYVDANIETLLELIEQVVKGEHFYTKESGILKYENMDSFTIGDLRQILKEGVKVRQPLPWYEVEGVFDSPKMCIGKSSGKIYIIEGYDGTQLVDNYENKLGRKSVTPLTPEEAAKYGVECDK